MRTTPRVAMPPARAGWPRRNDGVEWEFAAELRSERGDPVVSNTLRFGDRVRVKAGTGIRRYSAGEKGTVIEGPHQFGAGRGYYLVEMDQDQPQVLVILAEEEIEPDL
jgi:hypothetical protein